MSKKKGKIRQFSTGATRDTDEAKHDPEGFLSPAVIQRFNEYMDKNRIQKDGSTRDSDNWQHGIPRDAYVKSMWRHFLEVWKDHRDLPAEDIEESLCGVMFNSMGLLFEVLLDRDAGK